MNIWMNRSIGMELNILMECNFLCVDMELIFLWKKFFLNIISVGG